MSINQKRINRMTKSLTEEEYGSKMAFNKEALIEAHVRREEATRYDELFFDEPVPKPRCEIEKEKTKMNLVGVYNFFRSNVLDLRP